jgi:hypothetical protein
LLLDDLFPAIAALDIFNVDFSEEERGHVAAIIYSGCEDVHTANLDVSSYPSSDKFDRSDEEFKFNACTDNFKKYSKLIFGDEATPLTSLKGRTLCFKQLIIGQGGSLDMACVDKQRAVTLRKGRDAIVRSLNLHDKPSPQGLSVMVLTKHTWPTMCEDITTMVHKQLLMEDIPIMCIDPGMFSAEDEIELMQSATLIVAVHGTVSLMSLFAKDGAVVISIGQEGEPLKDGQTLPYATHIKALYTTEERVESMPSLIRYGLFTAASNFDIPFTF